MFLRQPIYCYEREREPPNQSYYENKQCTSVFGNFRYHISKFFEALIQIQNEIYWLKYS